MFYIQANHNLMIIVLHLKSVFVIVLYWAEKPFLGSVNKSMYVCMYYILSTLTQ